MKFEKIDEIRYRGTFEQGEEEKIQNIVHELSIGLENDFEESISATFVDSLVGRYTAANFFKLYPIEDAYFTTVTVAGFGREIEVSVGSIPITEKIFKKSSGVLYR